MGKINVLGFEIANLIAAGEVVDRPASVLKELLENAIDAGAKHITAAIVGGGIQSIRIQDDGCGMTREDLPVALKRHATSKIHSQDDLTGITTLGFRGEALAAISSVSHVTIISKTQDADMGTMLQAQYGEVQNIEEVGCSNGTTILVENLFENVPARRKFLKKDASEASACLAYIEKIAMSHPEIGITFSCDGKIKFATTGNNQIKDVLYALYGKAFASRLVKIQGVTNGIKVYGYVGMPDNAHGTRNMQNTFINGRYVKSKTVQAALERAFTSYMAPEKYPVSALYLDLNPQVVDVNVHPAKLEVRFTEEHDVFEAVYWNVRSALEEHTERPELVLPQKKKDIIHSFEQMDTPKEKEPSKPWSFEDLPKEAQTKTQETGASSVQEDSSSAFLQALEHVRAQSIVAAAEEHPTTKKETPPMEVPSVVQKAMPVEIQGKPEQLVKPYKIIGIAFKCYIIVELDDKLLVIDQHAAHERILFEQLLKKQKEEGTIPRQCLLIPLFCELTGEETQTLVELKEELFKIGIEFVESSNGKGISLTSMPEKCTPQEVKLLVQDYAQEALSSGASLEIVNAKRRERMLYQIACKGAIKGGRVYTDSEIEWLVSQVLLMDEITVCPHGRPIAYELSKNQFDRFFDRIK